MNDTHMTQATEDNRVRDGHLVIIGGHEDRQHGMEILTRFV